jgi:hypothetical protein
VVESNNARGIGVLGENPGVNNNWGFSFFGSHFFNLIGFKVLSGA